MSDETYVIFWSGSKERRGECRSILGLEQETYAPPVRHELPRQIDRLPRTRAQLRAGLNDSERKKLRRA